MGDKNSPDMVQKKKFKVSIESDSELDLVYHLTTLFKRNSTTEIKYNTSGDSVEDCTESLRDIIRPKPQTNQPVQGVNEKSKNLTDTSRMELLLNVAHFFRHMQEKSIPHGKLDSSCIYIKVDGKHLAIGDKTKAPQEDLKCLGKLVLHVLSNGKVIDDEMCKNSSTYEKLKKDFEKGEVAASELIYVYENLIKETTTNDDTIQQNDQTNSTKNKLKYLHGLLDCDEPSLAYNLILDKLYAGATFPEIFCHPFWWPPNKKCQFICAAFGYFREIHAFENGYREEYDDTLRENYGIDGKNVFSRKGWIKKLVIDAKAIGVIERNCGVMIGRRTIQSESKNYHKHSLYDLMRFFRNYYCHFWEQSEHVQCAFGKGAAGFWKFFATRFPNFLQHVYGKLWIEVGIGPEFDLFEEPAPESEYFTGEKSIQFR